MLELIKNIQRHGYISWLLFVVVFFVKGQKSHRKVNSECFYTDTESIEICVKLYRSYSYSKNY